MSTGRPDVTTPDEFRDRMQALAASDLDFETMYQRADALLMEMLTDLGYGDGVYVFDGLPKWYA